MSILKIIRDSMFDYAENAVRNAENDYKKTKKDCTIVSLVIFVLCGIALLMRAYLF